MFVDRDVPAHRQGHKCVQLCNAPPCGNLWIPTTQHVCVNRKSQSQSCHPQQHPLWRKHRIALYLWYSIICLSTSSHRNVFFAKLEGFFVLLTCRGIVSVQTEENQWGVHTLESSLWLCTDGIASLDLSVKLSTSQQSAGNRALWKWAENRLNVKYLDVQMLHITPDVRAHYHQTIRSDRAVFVLTDTRTSSLVFLKQKHWAAWARLSTWWGIWRQRGNQLLVPSSIPIPHMWNQSVLRIRRGEKIQTTTNKSQSFNLIFSLKSL